MAWLPSKKRIWSASFADTVNNTLFTIHHHGYVILDRQWREAIEVRDSNRLYIVKSGSGTVLIDGTTVRLFGGHAYLFPVNRKISFSCDDILEKFFIHFSLSLHGLFDIFELYEPNGYARAVDPSVFGVIDRFSTENLKESLAVHDVLRPIITSFIGPERSDIPMKITLAQKYRPLLSHIDANLSIALSLNDLADIMNLTPAYLSSSFKRDTGKTLKRVIIGHIVRRAERELVSTDRKIRDIAGELGFADEFYFSKFFKRETGIPPTVYRQQHT
ncbi:MAG: helix-turn-helix transcriptional regulator [Spirochaetes bacterium]|nr:helix-turn-helix transcriptional regulator [Spirochaetota bacterium]